MAELRRNINRSLLLCEVYYYTAFHGARIKEIIISQTSRRGVRFGALDDSMAVDKAIEHSAGEQTATNLPCVLIATRTLAWKGSNEIFIQSMIFLRFQRRDQLVTKLRAASDANESNGEGTGWRAGRSRVRSEFAKLRFENSKATFTEHRHARHDNML